MKTIRRAKISEAVKETRGSQSSLSGNPNGSSAGDGADASGNPEWLPPKQLLQPPGQLQLSDAQLEEELTRILNANNPHAPQNIARWNYKEHMYKASPYAEHMVTHFEFDGYLVYKMEERRVEDEGGDKGDGAPKPDEGLPENGEALQSEPEPLLLEDKQKATTKVPARNQFNYSERATQTVNNPLRPRATNTEPPPHRTFAGSVNQWSIYDAYIEDTQAKERAKEKAKAQGGKGHKDEDRPVALAAESSHAEDIYHSADFLRRLGTLERMANQNTFDEITQDFKYWDDAADELRDSKEGTLLPLWEFAYLKEKKKHVTALAWNPVSTDLFVVAYGSYQFTKQGPGILCCFSLKNPSYPEYSFHTNSGVMAVDVHPKRPYLVAAGLYDGSLLVYDLSCPAIPSGSGGLGGSGAGIWGTFSSGSGSAASSGTSSGSAGGSMCGGQLRYRSDIKTQHTDSVWQIAWQPDDLDGNPNFFSVSGDGIVKQAVLVKNDLSMTNVIRLQKNGDPLIGLCFDFHKTNDHIFVVGTEEGALIKCSKDYNSQYLHTFDGHSMAIYRVVYNVFYPVVFLTASADWTVKLWDHTISKPVLLFDFGCPVADIAWAPYSSTVFAVATTEGRIVVYDLDVSKYDPICNQQVVSGKTRLTHVAFSLFDPILLVGDDRGMVSSFKLSPNLRRAGRGGNPLSFEDHKDRLERIVLLSQGKNASN